MFTEESFTKAMHEWKKKRQATHNEVSFSLKQKEILPLVTTWMNVEDTVLRKISQSPKDKNGKILLMQGI